MKFSDESKWRISHIITNSMTVVSVDELGRLGDDLLAPSSKAWVLIEMKVEREETSDWNFSTSYAIITDGEDYHPIKITRDGWVLATNNEYEDITLRKLDLPIVSRAIDRCLHG